MGGETVVHLRGKGPGGRNQEIALSAALGIEAVSYTHLEPDGKRNGNSQL